MGFFINEHQNFSGNATDLANLASQSARYLGLLGDLEKINERIVRYYVSEGLVERPERVGRDAQYDYKHLLQFLAGRFLVESGFPMQKVGPYLMTQSIHELEALITYRNKPNMAELLVASFQRGGLERREGREGRAARAVKNRPLRTFTTEVDINKRVFHQRRQSDEDRLGINDSISLPSNSMAQASSENPSIFEMHSADMHSADQQINSAASARDHLDLVQSQIYDLSQSMQEQFNRIRDEMDRERARSRQEHEQERTQWRKEQEALQNKIDQLIAIVAKQNKGQENE